MCIFAVIIPAYCILLLLLFGVSRWFVTSQTGWSFGTAVGLIALYSIWLLTLKHKQGRYFSPFVDARHSAVMMLVGFVPILIWIICIPLFHNIPR